MSSTPTDFTEARQRIPAQMPLGMDYVLTEEEKRIMLECRRESFFYRSVPFSVISMAITQALVTRGALSASPRFGSLPKVAFAGFCGYLAGKISYGKTCLEKFKRLENSPLGEILRQRAGMPRHHSSSGGQSERNDPNTSSFDAMFQPTEAPNTPSLDDDNYGFNPDEPVQASRADGFSAPVQSYMDENAEPRKKPVLYEDLRHKNRENYEVTLIQKADTMVRAPSEESERPKKQVKKNIYGDTWEE
uniref:OCIA domain-containing protein 1 n=1 Tax=Nothobranchius kuhntae TaxID=321403 RepID=A0A1A8KNT6_NOTKU